MMVKMMKHREGDEPAWDEYMQHSQAATPYHLVG